MPERRPTADLATTDQTIQQTPDPESEPQQKKSWLDLSFTQVAGGALAAMTAAVLGSRFSVEGTVVGAALVSVIAALAGAFYTASLRRTHETVRVVLRRWPGGTNSPSTPSRPVPHGSTAVAPRSLTTPAGPADRSAEASRRRTFMVRLVVGAVAMFALAAGGLTMYEVLTGHALSGGSGTTFSQVRQEPEARPTDAQSPDPSESADPSATAEPTAPDTAEPSDTPEAEPSPAEESSPEASTEPSPEPTTEPSVSPRTQPSASAAQPSTAPS